MDASLFTKTQQAILGVLSDGLPHSMDELKACFDDELVDDGTVRFHLSNTRAVLRKHGEDILCVIVNRRYRYRHVRLLASAVNGYS